MRPQPEFIASIFARTFGSAATCSPLKTVFTVTDDPPLPVPLI
jgi:hypothetical protein